MSSVWEFYKKKFFPLFIISFIMSLITTYISASINLTELQSITDPQEFLVKMKDFIKPMLLISLISLFFSTIIQYYIIYNPLDQENNIFRCIINSLRYFIPYLIIMILLAFFGSFALLLGLIVLIIGILFSALYIVTLYLFFLPVLMVEGPSIANAISRTFTLMHRNFWTNIGWTAVFIIIMLVASVLLSGLALLPFSGNFLKVFTNPQDVTALVDLATNPIYIILNSIVSALIYPAMPVFACILYFNGRAREEIQGIEGSQRDGTQEKPRIEDLYSKSNTDDRPENSQNT